MKEIVRRGGLGAVALAALGLMGCAQLFGPSGDVPQAPNGGSWVQGQGQTIPDRFVVVLRPGVDPGATAQELAARHGGQVRHVYRFALNGFALQVPAPAARQIARDPRVLFVSPDEWKRIVQGPPPGAGPGGGTQPPQEVPTGVDRIEVDKRFDLANTTVSVGVEVAIIDTGIDGDHPDLNVLGDVNFSGGPSGAWDDGNGHGTHVAGTVAALDNDIGVVGVAPGAGSGP
jgi:subtilisin family serine protease